MVEKITQREYGSKQVAARGQNFQISTIRITTFDTRRTAWKNASPICWWPKNKIYHPTFITAFRINKAIINLKFFCAEYLFHTIKTATELKMKITVHAISINVLDGVHVGRLIVLYHTLPVCAKYDAAEPVITTSKGIRK